MSVERNPFFYLFVENNSDIEEQAHYLQQHNRQHPNPDIRETYQKTEAIATYVCDFLNLNEDTYQADFIAEELNNWLKYQPLHSHISITAFTLFIYEQAGLEISLQTLLTQLLCSCFSISLPAELQSPIQTEWIVTPFHLNEEDVI